MNLEKITASRLSKMLRGKEVTATEVVESYLLAIDERNTDTGAYITVTKELALSQALEADQRLQSDQSLSLLDGIPIGIKDNFLTKGIKTTCASSFYSNFIAPYESTITDNLNKAGMVCLGKTNLDEFAMGSTNLNSAFGPVKNPFLAKDGIDRVAGGSSGGSAAAVAGNLATLSTGTDTGGSIRLPAAFCGITAMKPTYGVCSRYGIFAFASSLDQAGPMSKSVLDNAMLLNIMAGYDSKDATMVKFTPKDYTHNLGGLTTKSVRVGYIKEYDQYNLAPDIKNAYHRSLKILEQAGVQLEELSLKYHDMVVPVYYTIAPVEAASNLARYDGIRYGNRAEGESLNDIYVNSKSKYFGDEVKARILIGNFNILHENYSTYINAAKMRSKITNDFSSFFKKVDFILTPTSSNIADKINESKDQIEVYKNDSFTAVANLTGIPAINIPYGLAENGLPIGIQLMANYYQEDYLYQIAYFLEKEFKFVKVTD